jgi:hypothetical protein
MGTASSNPVHPALHFDMDKKMASVGVQDANGVTTLIQRGPDGTVHTLGSVAVQPLLAPAPLHCPPLANRWSAANRADFTAKPSAYTFGQVVSALRKTLRTYVDFGQEEATLVACWIVGTYFHPLFPAFPRLALNGERGSGKTRVLQLIALTAFNGRLEISPTQAVLYRSIDPLRCTFCIDEAEHVMGIGDIIRSGYKRGGYVTRNEKQGDKYVPVSYRVDAPMAFGSINELDATDMDRSLRIVMEKSVNKAIVNLEVQDTAPIFTQLRDALHRLVLMSWEKVDEVRRSLDTPHPALIGRPWELFKPLFVIAKLAELGTDHLLTLAEQRIGAEPTLPDEGRALFQEIQKRLALYDSVKVYPKLLMAGMHLDLTVPVSAKRVGALLRRYGFKAEKETARGIPYHLTRADFLTRAKRWGFAASGFSVPSAEHWDCDKGPSLDALPAMKE